MTPRHSTVLTKILERISEPSDDEHAAFTFEDVQLWPVGAVEALVAGKIFKQGMSADTVTCRGCESRCLRPVMVVEVGTNRPLTLMSTCHLKADMGPFEISAERLTRWTCSRDGVAKFVARNLRGQVKDHDDRWRRVRFGAVQVSGVRRLMSIEFEGAAIMRIGSSSIPLIELLEWEEARIGVSTETLAHYATQSDDALSGSKRVQPSTTVREDNKLFNKLKVDRVQRSLEALAGQHPNLNKEQLAKKLAKAGMGEGMSAERIERVTRMPARK